MKKKSIFYRCDICHNFVDLLDEHGGTLVCCNQPMTKLVPNTSDGAGEKHVPVVKLEDNNLIVEIGSVEHPMTPEHLIEWIAVVTEDGTDRVNLSHQDQPKAIFYNKTHGDVYEYCNLHGLWKIEFH